MTIMTDDHNDYDNSAIMMTIMIMTMVIMTIMMMMTADDND